MTEQTCPIHGVKYFMWCPTCFPNGYPATLTTTSDTKLFIDGQATFSAGGDAIGDPDICKKCGYYFFHCICNNPPHIPEQEMPEEQPFQKFSKIEKHILRMANTGHTGSGSEWSAFLRELNSICFLPLSIIKWTVANKIHQDMGYWAMDSNAFALTDERLVEEFLKDQEKQKK